MTPTLMDVLTLLRPNAEFVVPSPEATLDEVRWDDKEQKKPTKAEVDKALAHFERLNYKHLRASKYPAIGEQLDNLTKVLIHLKTNGLDIGPDGEAQIKLSKAVKKRHPKTP